LFVSGDGLKDVALFSLIDGIPVDRPCGCERRRVIHEENEKFLTRKKSRQVKDFRNGLARIPGSRLFSRDGNLEGGTISRSCRARAFKEIRRTDLRFCQFRMEIILVFDVMWHIFWTVT
jgi:hypothetical protein